MLRLRAQFSLKTVFVLVTLAAVFLAWRLHRSSEARVVAAVQAAGGRAYVAWQSPSPRATYFSVAMRPGYTYLSQVQIDVDSSATPAVPTIIQQILGSETDSGVTAVQLSLDQLTPEMATRLKSLRQLRWIVVNMPAGMVANDSDDGRRLAELQTEFPAVVWPAYNPATY